MFNDTALEVELDVAGYQFSSANSINIGRLIPQVAYYVYAYAKLYKNGAIAKDEKINVVVPTGNFGNILAAFYAKNMGLPIAKLICASNENKVLYDFFSTGTYDRNRDFILTSSPSMDILISSNLERLIYRIAGNDAEKNTKMMEELSTDGKYAITDEMRAQLADFYGNYTSEEETAKLIYQLKVTHSIIFRINRIHNASGKLKRTCRAGNYGLCLGIPGILLILIVYPCRNCCMGINDISGILI